MRRFFVPFSNSAPDQFAFDRDETRHIQRVLRLIEGDEVNVFDGEGREFRCVIEGFKGKIATARVLKQIDAVAHESKLALTLAAALIKGDKFDLVIQKAVELGVSSFVPLATKRSDVKAKNIDRKLERWRKIIIEASKQCGRATLMKISEPEDFENFVEMSEGTKLIFSEKNGNSFSAVKPDKRITAVVGPEGGWDDSEIEFAKKSGFQIITLGGRILRAETAAISIPAILQNQFGDIN